MNDFMKMHYYSIVEKVAKGNTLSKTAKDLNISQPAISKIITSVENYEGIKIFNREKRAWTLTEAGKLFLEKAMAIKKINADFEEKIKLLSGFPTVNVLLPMLEMTLYNEKLYKEFEKLNYSFIFHTELAELPLIENFLLFEESEVNNREFNFAVLILPKITTSVDFIPLKRYRFLAIVPKNLIKETSTEKGKFFKVIKLANLSHLPVALPRRGLTIRRNILDMYKKAHIKPIVNNETLIYTDNHEINPSTLRDCIAFIQEEYIQNEHLAFDTKQFDIFEIADSDNIGAYQEIILAYKKGKTFSQEELIIINLIKKVIN